MLSILKNYFLFIFILSLSLDGKAEINPHEFIDSKAQEMVQVLKENSELFYTDRDAYEDKIKVINIYESEMFDYPFPRSEKTIRALATLRGSQSGFVAAESFKLVYERI